MFRLFMQEAWLRDQCFSYYSFLCLFIRVHLTPFRFNFRFSKNYGRSTACNNIFRWFRVVDVYSMRTYFSRSIKSKDSCFINKRNRSASKVQLVRRAIQASQFLLRALRFRIIFLLLVTSSMFSSLLAFF